MIREYWKDTGLQSTGIAMFLDSSGGKSVYAFPDNDTPTVINFKFYFHQEIHAQETVIALLVSAWRHDCHLGTLHFIGADVDGFSPYGTGIFASSDSRRTNPADFAQPDGGQGGSP